MSQLHQMMHQFTGKSADEIAQLIRKRGIRGRMGTTARCPMALLLGGEGTGRFVIGRKYIVRQAGKELEKMATPKNVAAFVRKFDIGGYPELIAPPPRCTHKASDPRPRPKGPNSRPQRIGLTHHIAKLVGRFE